MTTPPAVRSWLGIPYATAERFRSPQLLPFNSDLLYDQKGPAPLQAGDTSWLEADNGFSEDCLNLNVWAPENAGDELLPVVVYIFGGGYALGANAQTTSNASGLAATGRAVGVSLNYRLGPLGWLSLSQFGGRFADATNLGLQDMITALGWVRENIARFGGDPNNVTVTGHSAGAYSTTSLLAAPSADGLYHHLAAFSGAASRITPAWYAEELADRFLTELDARDHPERLLDLGGQLLVDTFAKIGAGDADQRNGVDVMTLGLVDDHAQPGAVLSGHPLQVLESGAHRDIDILFSSATDEMDYWVINTPDQYDPGSTAAIVETFATVNRVPRSRAARIVGSYQREDRAPINVRAAVSNDYFFTLPAIRSALAHAAAGGTAHLLSIGPAEGAPAVHGTEMYGIVGQERPGRSEEQAVRDTQVRDILLDLASGEPLWEPVTVTSPITKGIGTRPYDASDHATWVLEIFDGIDRP